MDQQKDWGTLQTPFGDGIKAKIEADDPKALAFGMACVAAHLLACAGIDQTGFDLTRSMLLAGKNPQAMAMVAAALDIIDVLRISPTGQKALAEFFSKPGL